MTDHSADIVYLDTNFFIKAVEGTKAAAAPAQELIATLRLRAKLAVTSEITIAEVLAPSKSADALPISIKRRVYLDLLLWSKFIKLISVDREILMATIDLRVVAPMKLPDAIHLASAVGAGCRYFVSADHGFKKLPAGMEFIKSDENSLDGLIKKLSE